MNNSQEKVLDQIQTKTTAGVLSAFSIATILPFFLHQQLITGPIINAMLFLAVVFLGLRWAIILSFIPSIMALTGGLLLPFLTPIVPFIMLSNIIMVFLFAKFYNLNANISINFWQGVLTGSLAKSFFLMICGFLVLNYFKNPQAVKLAVSALGVLQFGTAVVGGSIAFGFLKFVKKI